MALSFESASNHIIKQFDQLKLRLNSEWNNQWYEVAGKMYYLSEGKTYLSVQDAVLHESKGQCTFAGPCVHRDKHTGVWMDLRERNVKKVILSDDGKYEEIAQIVEAIVSQVLNCESPSSHCRPKNFLRRRKSLPECPAPVKDPTPTSPVSESIISRVRSPRRFPTLKPAKALFPPSPRPERTFSLETPEYFDDDDSEKPPLSRSHAKSLP